MVNAFTLFQIPCFYHKKNNHACFWIPTSCPDVTDNILELGKFIGGQIHFLLMCPKCEYMYVLCSVPTSVPILMPISGDHYTMYDYHDFGLTWKCQKVFPCGCTITLKSKINVIWNFFYTSGTLHSKKFQTILILSFEANILSRENETKIVKIRHSALVTISDR